MSRPNRLPTGLCALSLVLPGCGAASNPGPPPYEVDLVGLNASLESAVLSGYDEGLGLCGIDVKVADPSPGRLVAKWTWRLPDEQDFRVLPFEGVVATSGGSPGTTDPAGFGREAAPDSPGRRIYPGEIWNAEPGVDRFSFGLLLVPTAEGLGLLPASRRGHPGASYTPAPPVVLLPSPLRDARLGQLALEADGWVLPEREGRAEWPVTWEGALGAAGAKEPQLHLRMELDVEAR